MSNTPTAVTLTGISSMATRPVLADLSHLFTQQTGIAVSIESVGGVDAAKRVQAGEAFDLVLLARDAMHKLADAGHVATDSLTDYVLSPVAMAVQAGQAQPAIASGAQVKAAVEAATSIGYSTGPSGQALAKWFERWGIADAVAAKLKVPPPGTPVGAWVASGDIALGFQQLSELLPLQGITIVGNLPDDMAMTTTFSGGVASVSTQAAAANQFLAFLNSPAASAIKRRHGMADMA